MFDLFRQALPQGRPTRKRARKVRPARLPMAAAADYLVDLWRMQRAFEAAVRRVVYPQLDRMLEASKVLRPDAAGLRIDAAAEDVDSIVSELSALVGVGPLFDSIAAELIARRLAVRVSGFQRTQLTRQAKRAIGIDLVIAEPWLRDHLALFVRDNVALIKTIPTGQLAEVEGILRRALRSDLRADEIRKQIEARFGLSRYKAKRIAVDQTLSLNSELNHLRMQSVGLHEATWSTSKDERVRPANGREGGENHRVLEGVPFRLDTPPVVNKRTGERAKPGQPVLCRCISIPVFDALLDGDGEG